MTNAPPVITVGLNPAIDRIIEVQGFEIGAHQVGREVARTAAGKALNVSRVLAALGIRSIATGFLGEGNRPEFEPLLRDPLIVDEFFTLAGRTRQNVTITDPIAHRETHIRDAGLEVSRRDFDRLGKKLQLLARPRSIVIFSGSLPPGATADDLAGLVETSAAGGARVAVDTGGDALESVVRMGLWLIKPNAAELSQLVSRKLTSRADLVAAGRELTADVETVLVSRAERGALLVMRDAALGAAVRVDGRRLRNTVGCGDVLLGAFVAGVAHDADAADALASAVACASASACGVSTAQFEPALVEELKPKVRLERL